MKFLKENDITGNFLIYANSVDLFTDIRDFREYFNIAYSKNLGDIINQFKQWLARFIPTKVTDKKTGAQRIWKLGQSIPHLEIIDGMYGKVSDIEEVISLEEIRDWV